MGAREERGAVQKENGGAGRDFPAQSQEEESGVGAGGCGEAAVLISVFLNQRTDTLRSASPLSQGNKHKQISDRLRDAQSKRWILKAEVDLINQKRDTRISEISTLQLHFEAG